MKILIVVDMQNDFITGSLGTPEAKAIVPNVKKKVNEYVENGDWVIYTRDTHFENYLNTKEGKNLPVSHCICGTDGWRIPDELYPSADYENTKTINKHTFGSIDVLPNYVWAINDEQFISEIELVGVCTDIYVVSNALILKANFPDMDISIDASCCAGVTPESHKAALLTMKMCQINVIGE